MLAKHAVETNYARFEGSFVFFVGMVGFVAVLLVRRFVSHFIGVGGSMRWKALSLMFLLTVLELFTRASVAHHHQPNLSFHHYQSQKASLRNFFPRKAYKVSAEDVKMTWGDTTSELPGRSKYVHPKLVYERRGLFSQAVISALNLNLLDNHQSVSSPLLSRKDNPLFLVPSRI